MKRTAGIIVAICTGILIGCNVSPRRTLPTEPSVVTAPAGPETTGRVTDSALRPLGAVRVEVVDGPRAGLIVTTDSLGIFRFPGEFVEGTRIRASKEGHVAVTVAFSTTCAACPITIHLAVERPSIDLSGQYSLTLSTDVACTELPTELRSRSFLANVVSSARTDLPADTSFDVTLADPAVLGDYSRFWIHTAGDYATFFLEAGGPAVVEQIAANSYMTFRGVAGSSVTVGSGTISISTAFDGYLHNCTLPPGPFQLGACDSAAGHAGCHSKNNRLTFTKR